MSRSFSSMLAACLMVSSCFAGNKDKEANSLLNRARQLSDIRAENSPPFILKAEFKILQGSNDAIDGTYTEIWKSRSLLRTEISAGNYHRIEVINDRKRWESSSTPGTPPQDINSAANTIAYRLGNLSLDSRGAQSALDRSNGSWLLRCIAGYDDGFGGRTELCFDKSKGEFVAESVGFLSQSGEKIKKCAFTDFQKFGDKLFPRSVQCVEAGGEIFEGKVIELTLDTQNDNSIFAAPSGAKESPNCPIPMQPPTPIETPDPATTLAKPVVLSLYVGVDGTPHDIQVATSAGYVADNAAVEAARRWRFKPATCGGEPMESLINVIVH